MSALRNLGATLLAARRVPDAIPFLQRAAELDETDPGTHKNLGLAFAMTGQSAAAIEHLRTSLQLQPKDASVHNNLGSLLAQRGEWQEALVHFQQATRLAPDEPELPAKLERSGTKMARSAIGRLAMNIRLALLMVATCGTSPLYAQVFRYELEQGTLMGTEVRSNGSGYSGSGYVTDFDSSGGTDAVQLQVDVPAGVYEMWVGYRSPFGEKGYEFQVDGQFGSGMFTESTSFSVDRAGIFELDAGTNTLGIYQGWGYYDVDYLEFRPFVPPALDPVPAQLNNSQANGSTRMLMNYLVHEYGQRTLSGQQHNVWTNPAFPEPAYLQKSGGLSPAIRGSDLVRYSPSRVAFGETNNNETEQAIQWAEQTGGIVTMAWHWNAPADLINQPGMEWWRGFYTNATTFDLPGALANPGSDDYQLLLRDIDAIAVELKKFEDANVPVLWRPLHEAQGGWFWWGAHGPDHFKALWNLMHDRLTNTHGLDNLIWEFTSLAAEGDHLDWYPGDDVVDMVGIDIYTQPGASMSGEWHDLLAHYNGRKMLALSETGTLPNADLMDTFGIEWSYFSPWYDRWQDVPDAELQALLGHEDVITLDELPGLPWGDTYAPTGDFDFNGRFDCGDADLLVAAIAAGDLAFDLTGNGIVDSADLLQWLAWAGEQELGPGQTFLPGDANLDGLVDGQDFIAWNNHKFTMTAAWCAGDFNADGVVDGQDFVIWNNYKFTAASSVPAVPESRFGCGGLAVVCLLLMRWVGARPTRCVTVKSRLQSAP